MGSPRCPKGSGGLGGQATRSVKINSLLSRKTSLFLSIERSGFTLYETKQPERYVIISEKLFADGEKYASVIDSSRAVPRLHALVMFLLTAVPKDIVQAHRSDIRAA